MQSLPCCYCHCDASFLLQVSRWCPYCRWVPRKGRWWYRREPHSSCTARWRRCPWPTSPGSSMRLGLFLPILFFTILSLSFSFFSFPHSFICSFIPFLCPSFLSFLFFFFLVLPSFVCSFIHSSLFFFFPSFLPFFL